MPNRVIRPLIKRYVNFLGNLYGNNIWPVFVVFFYFLEIYSIWLLSRVQYKLVVNGSSSSLSFPMKVDFHTEINSPKISKLTDECFSIHQKKRRKKYGKYEMNLLSFDCQKNCFKIEK